MSSSPLESSNFCSLHLRNVVSAICAIMDEINTEHNMNEVNMPRGSGSVDRAPDSQWTNASSNPRGAHFDTLASLLFEPMRENKNVVTSRQ